MPDRYDPKLSVRPPSRDKGADTGRGQSAGVNDPLAELAKIVSGRPGSGSSASSPRSRTVPATATPARPTAEADVLGDLEAELLSDLQASFATVRDSLTAPAEPKAAQPAQPAQWAETRAEAALRHPAAPTMRVERPAEAPAASAPPPQPKPPQTVRAPANEPVGRPSPSPQKSTPAKLPAREATPAPATVAADRLDIPNMHLRLPVQPSPAEAPARQQHSRWVRPAEPQRPASSAASRFAPPGAAAPPVQPAANFDPVEDEPFGEGAPFGEAAGADDPEDRFVFDGDDLVPGYGDDDQLPPYPDDDLEALVKRRSGRGLAGVAAAMAVILIGGVSVIMFRTGDDSGSPLPIIAADGSPTKVTPADTGLAEGDQSKLIYDRVDSGDTAPEVTLVTPGDEPIADIPAVDRDMENPISRVIIPGGPGIDRPPADGVDPPGSAIDAATDMAALEDVEPIQPIGPRKVRTVVVKRDGTIVSNQATQDGAIGEPAVEDAAPVVAETMPVPPPPAPTTDDDTLAIAGTGRVGSGDGELAITPLPDGVDGPDPGVEVVAVNEPPPPPAAKPTPPPPAARPTPPTPAAKPTPTIVATGGANGPIDITPGRPASRPAVPAATQTAAVSGAGMMVQVSSQRSEEAARATFKDLQTRYPSVLGPYQVDVQRADLGGRGIYFRARVGPFPAGDAQRLCDDLKSAGGDCVLSRN